MRDYLSYGGSAVAQRLDISGSLEYLRSNGYGDGYLQHARDAIRSHGRRRFEFEPLNASYCDFCFAKLMGGEFDRLTDGRERCMRCTRTVLKTGEDFEELFADVKRNLEASFAVTVNVPMKVRMVNARDMARRTNETYQATPGVDARVLGFAAQRRDGYVLFIENGSPRLSAMATIAHELTHIWQYLNWNVDAIARRYGVTHRLAIYEGMATWAQVQYLLHLRENDAAERQEAYAEQRTDEYGAGFRIFKERYPLVRDGQSDSDSPFHHPYPF